MDISLNVAKSEPSGTHKRSSPTVLLLFRIYCRYYEYNSKPHNAIFITQKHKFVNMTDERIQNSFTANMDGYANQAVTKMKKNTIY